MIPPTSASHLIGTQLTTAHIFYHLPDHPLILQSYVWQHYDLCPDFPKLKRFLLFWQSSIEGRLHSVDVMSKDTKGFADFHCTEGEIIIH